MAGAVVEVMRRPRRRHVLGGADGKPLQPVVGVVGEHLRGDAQLVEPAAVVVAVGVARARAAVGDDVAAAVMGERARSRGPA